MRNSCQKPSFCWLLTLCRYIFYILLLGVAFSGAYLIYNRYPPLFERLLKLWPIGVLILSILLQYLYFETRFSVFLFLAGFFFIIGIMFNINLHNEFYNDFMGLPIIFLALAGSLLNYYIFKRRNIFLLPFILILIISSILLLLAPLYKEYISSSSLYLYLIIIVFISTCTIVKTNNK